MSKVLHFFLFFCITLTSFSQNSILSGSIVEAGTGMIVPGAIITIQGTPLAQATDENGEFSISQNIPSGEHILVVTKDGYEDNFLFVDILQGKKLIIGQIELSLTKTEEKRRKKLEKSLRKGNKKAEKEKEAKIKEAIKENEERDKSIAKEEKSYNKKDKAILGIFKRKPTQSVTMTYEDVPVELEEEMESRPQEIINETLSPIQIKYAGILGVDPNEISNVKLYEFIDEWMGTPYLLGGATKSGIDCSSFTQRLYTSTGMDDYIERTAQKQFDSADTKPFGDAVNLIEGDLVFFRAAGDPSDTIIHVGVYLGNNKFVNATSRNGQSGISGVKISDLSDPFWKRRFFAGGRRR